MYAFDPKPEAPATRKERFVWMLFMGALFFLLYGAANHFAHLSGPHPSLPMAWEREIPFVPAFIVPYMSSDLLFCAAFFMPYSRFELRVLAARVLFIVAVSVFCFLLFPLQFGFEKPDTDSFAWLFGLLRADLPYNQLPSLHIGFAVVLWASMRKYLANPLFKALLAGWFWLVVLSTLLVYQHHFIDLPTGAAVGLLALYAVPAGRESLLTGGFTTPRSLKVGLYYLAGSVLSVLAAFRFDGAALPFFWLFLSLLAVSLVYAFGLNRALAGRKGRANPLQWLLFFPYFFGSYLSWHYYRRKLPLMTHVLGHVYLGRLPAPVEYERLKSRGITRVINLAAEQQLQKAELPQERLPFLDLTIPSPEALHAVVMQIEATGERLYVHCALGLSRSILAVSAWLVYRGYSAEEIDALWRELRPAAVKSPYMEVALQLYREYLEGL
jgi:protein-tyrosine phosphatase